MGFRVVEALARQLGLAWVGEECRSRVAESADILLVQPQTYMNRSGYAVRCLRERRGFELADLLVVYDEVRLPLGKLRLRGQGSPAGHRGLESILEAMQGDEVPRLRLGVSGEDAPTTGAGLADYVLAPFAASEGEAVEAMVEAAASACRLWAEQGLEAAMGRFNG